jgi:predicted nucleic-acid-binding protein
MKGLDTNILIRFLVRDDEKQSQAVYRLFKNSEKSRETLFVPLLVVLETIWVLEAVYAVSREDILDAFETLLLMPLFVFEAQQVIRVFIASAKDAKADLSDLLIAASASSSGCGSVLTCDKNASKYSLFELIG